MTLKRLSIAGFVAALTVSSAQAAQITACDQTLTYTVTPPAAGTPTNAQAFSGVWTGQWQGGGGTPLCTVLIVQSVNADGSANVLYVWGKNEFVRTPGNQQVNAKISGDTLSWEGSISFSFRRSGSSLDATRRTSQGINSGSLRKQ